MNKVDLMISDIKNADAETVKKALLEALEWSSEVDENHGNDLMLENNPFGVTLKENEWQFQCSINLHSLNFAPKPTMEDFFRNLKQVVADVEDECVTTRQLKQRLKDLGDMANSF
jgi:hypothetical protein